MTAHPKVVPGLPLCIPGPALDVHLFYVEVAGEGEAWGQVGPLQAPIGGVSMENLPPCLHHAPLQLRPTMTRAPLATTPPLLSAPPGRMPHGCRGSHGRLTHRSVHARQGASHRRRRGWGGQGQVVRMVAVAKLPPPQLRRLGQVASATRWLAAGGWRPSCLGGRPQALHLALRHGASGLPHHHQGGSLLPPPCLLLLLLLPLEALRHLLVHLWGRRSPAWRAPSPGPSCWWVPPTSPPGHLGPGASWAPWARPPPAREPTTAPALPTTGGCSPCSSSSSSSPSSSSTVGSPPPSIRPTISFGTCQESWPHGRLIPVIDGECVRDARPRHRLPLVPVPP